MNELELSLEHSPTYLQCGTKEKNDFDSPQIYYSSYVLESYF